MIKIIQRKIDPSASMDADFHPLIQRILLARGVSSKADYSLELAGLIKPGELLNIKEAVELLQRSLEQQEKILIVGDFDADGATSTALLLLCLKDFGFSNVDYLVPNRFEFGYGLTPEIVEVAKQRQPALIITVDNGIASIEGVARARQYGIKVLITDHHLPAADLPEADCILNPNQHGCGFPSKSLAGVGVVYYLLLALRTALREASWFDQQSRTEPNMLQYLDLVALGTVADVVPLDRNNRCLVRHGLAVIRKGHARPGIKALLQIAGKNYRNLLAGDLGFALGPRLNAAGRLDDMSVGIECLLAENQQQAMHYAQLLNDLNQDRKNIEQGMHREALQIMDELVVDEDSRKDNKGICLFNENWHAGVVGIVASRLKEKFHRPAVVFAGADDNIEEIKGSARSIPGLHIRDLLDSIATGNPGLLNRFGGHAMAAGLSLNRSDFDRFAAAFEEALEKAVDASMLEQVLATDGELPLECFTLEFAELLEEAGPWGQHFPEPLFTGSFMVADQRILSGRHLKLAVIPAGSEILLDAIAFNVEPGLLDHSLQQLALAFRLQVNEFRGRRSAQLLIEHFIET
ncbi:MAG: single-stranded-DNA-specific exonuclease RecJ [Gammaproteobacteria bacterium]|nr:single-stranded-DNA-specific exonuclease RecJ [Gammaproteobacteria bacterium]